MFFFKMVFIFFINTFLESMISKHAWLLIRLLESMISKNAFILFLLIKIIINHYSKNIKMTMPSSTAALKVQIMKRKPIFKNKNKN